MPLAALLIADDEAHQPAAGPGTGMVPLLFGQTVPEFQARLSHAAGAAHIVLLAARLPAALIAGLDRLRADGIAVETVRTARDAADHIHPDETLLLLAGPIVPDSADLLALVNANEPCLWTQGSGQADVAMRIDAEEDWTGVALMNGSLLRDTCADLGDWELAPTLLRRAAQAGLRRQRREAAGLVPISSPEKALARARQLLSAPDTDPPRTISDRPLAALARLLAPALLRAPAGFRLIDGFALLIACAGFAASLGNWPIIGLALLLCGTVFAAIAGGIARLPLGKFTALKMYRRVAPWLAGGSLIALGWHNSAFPGNLTVLVLALWAASLLRPLPLRHAGYCDAPFMVLLLLLTMAAGYPVSGLWLCVAHGLASRLHAEHRG